MDWLLAAVTTIVLGQAVTGKLSFVVPLSKPE